MTNCTIKFLENNIAYNIFQNTIICLLAIYVIGINVSVIVLTMFCRSLWKCPVNKMMMSGHVSNIISIISFTMNDLYHSHNGITKPECKHGLDLYFFAFLGLMGATITLLFNSISAYTGIVRNSWMLSDNPTKNFKTFTSIWMIATGLSIPLVLFQKFHPDLMLVKGLILSLIFILISSGFLLQIIRVLNLSKKSNSTGRVASQAAIEKAISVIKISVICYTCTMFAGVAFTILTYFIKKDTVVLPMVWLCKLLQCIMFTLEPHMCIYKHPEYWRWLWQKYLCGRDNGDELRENNVVTNEGDQAV